MIKKRRIKYEEIEKLIDVECMRAGVPLSITPKPVLKEVPEIPQPTTEIYMVDSYSFTDKNDADELAALLSNVTSRVTTDYNYNVGSQYKYYKKYDTPVSVKKTLCYSKEEYNDFNSILKTRKKTEDYNHDIMNDYNELMSERRKTVDKVYEAISEAEVEVRKINNALNIYSKYVELSGGDEGIAKKFFTQNDKVSEYLDVVLKKYNSSKTV
ncbi:MAG TPA: hypothetical protein GX708_23110 [Gallicola sp.]|nr:hypothetical protein [Gallicola sp.]